VAWEDRHYNRDEAPRLRMSVPMPTPMTIAVMARASLRSLMVNVFGVTALAKYGALTFLDATAFKQPWRFSPMRIFTATAHTSFGIS